MQPLPAPPGKRKTAAEPEPEVPKCCGICHKQFDERNLLCASCHSYKQSRMGWIMIDPYPRLLQILNGVKEAALRTLDARASTHTAWYPTEMQVFNSFHAAANVFAPSFKHISPIHEIKGQAKHWHAWEFKVMSGEATESLFDRVFREPYEIGSMRVLAHGGVLAIVPASVVFRIKAKGYYLQPRSCLPMARLTVDTVALSPTANGACCEWRWPEDVAYDDDSMEAIRRYMSSLILRLHDKGAPLSSRVVEEAENWAGRCDSD